MNKEAIFTEQEKELSGNELVGIAARKKQSLESKREEIFAIDSGDDARKMLEGLKKGRKSFLEAAGAEEKDNESVSEVLALYDSYISHLEEKLKEGASEEIIAGEEGLHKWELARKNATVLQDYIKVTEQYSAKFAEIAAL